MPDQLQAVPLVTPGFKGLNKAQASVPDLDPGWAIECQNFIFDISGRLACRNGWTVATSSPLAGTPAIASMGELVLAGGTYVVSAANNKLYSGTTTLTNITGSLTITGNNWQWLTFNGAIYGVQAGHPLITWNGTGNFTAVSASSGTVPSGGSCGVAAFGRLWIVGPDGQTINYCNLLDATAWSGIVVGSGSLNMATVWTRGIDSIVGIGAAGNKLVVFGTNQIVLFVDSAGASIGINPSNIIVYDTVEGTGLAARDSIQSTGEGDLTYLSPTGVQSLSRLLSSGKDNPVNSLDPQIRDYLLNYYVNEVPAAIRSAYSPNNRFYVLLFPVAMRAFVYDTRITLQDGSRRVTEWPAVTWTAILNQRAGSVLFGELGVVGTYGGYLDKGANTFGIVYNSPQLALAAQDPKASLENRQKILKLLKAVIYYGGTTTINFSWGVDFQGLGNAGSIALTGTLSEYAIAQYNINEYGGGAGLLVLRQPLSGSGRWVQFGVTATINGFQIAIQQLDAFVKIGNMR